MGVQTTPKADVTQLINFFFTMAGALKRFMPLFDRVLVQKAEAITKTKGGLIIPEKAVAKVNTAKVLAVGAGLRSESVEVIPPAVAVGDEVMVPDFGGQKKLSWKEMIISCIGTLIFLQSSNLNK